jgi:hypothetical protein
VRLFKRHRPAPGPTSAIEDVFTSIYRHGTWTSHDNVESLSGRGSTLWRTEALRRELPALLRRLEVRTLLDAACGDFNWLSTVDLPLRRYRGLDVVREVVEANQRRYGSAARSFKTADITRDRLPSCDAILCRDCLHHLSFDHISAALANFRRTGARYVLLTTHPAVTENEDCVTGSWRLLNLQLPPINLPNPLELVLENEDYGKYLGVWRLKDLPKSNPLR